MAPLARPQELSLLVKVDKVSSRMSYKPFLRSFTRHTGRVSQRGDALIEGLVGMVLVAILGVGPVYVASRAALSQRYMNMQNIAVNKLVELHKSTGSNLCTGSYSISVGGQSLPVTVTCTTRSDTAITVGGSAVVLTGSPSASSPSLSVTSTSLFGGVGTIVVGQ